MPERINSLPLGKVAGVNFDSASVLFVKVNGLAGVGINALEDVFCPDRVF